MSKPILKKRQRTTLAALLLCTAAAIHAATQSPALAFDLPAQPLDAALRAYARQAGVALSFDAREAARKQAPALRATMTAQAALQHLLRGSGLTWRAAGANRYAVVRAADAAAAWPLEPVRVYGDATRERVYTEQEIAATPASNRDLSALIATHPAIRESGTAEDGANRGTLNVEDISIHGASPYQNLFLIDGVGATSRVDPANKSRNFTDVPSNPQAYFLDTALLGEVRVFDNSIPVEYGAFNGGVVDARLRRPSGENHVKLDYRWNGSNLTRQKIAPGNAEDWLQGTPDFTPSWRKRFHTASADIALGERAGLVLGLSRRISRIERWRLGAVGHLDRPERDDSLDRVDNLLGKFSLRLDADTITDLSLKYADRREHLVSNFFRDTDWRNRHGAQGAVWNIEHTLRGGKLSAQLGWDRFDSHRNSAHTEFVQHDFVDGRPGFASGGYGKDEKGQRNLTLATRLDLAPIQTGPVSHASYVGLQVEHTGARFKRYNQSYSYRAVHREDGTEKHFSKVRHLPGSVTLDYTRLGLYASDELTWRRWTLNAGLRYDRDNFLHHRTLAPRARLDWDVLGSDDTVLSAGWSRYYGGHVLKIAMQEEFSRLSEQVLDHHGDPVPNGRKITRVNYDGLRSPYDDEWAFSLAQRAYGIRGVLTFVHRNGRDQVTRRGDSRVGYRYTNEGNSRTDGWNLTLANEEAWRLGETLWHAQASWGYQRNKRNLNLAEGYESSPVERADYVYYNGKRIPAANLPPSNFNLPHKVSLDLTGHWPRHGLTWSNTVNWHGRRKEIAFVDTGPAPEYLDMYESLSAPSYWSWDTRLIWQPPFARQVTLALDVLNVLNRIAALTTNPRDSLIDARRYRTGREIWLQVGYRY